jgi:hypothetical protein
LEAGIPDAAQDRLRGIRERSEMEMEMAGRLVLIFLLVAFGSLLSRSLIPPGKLSRQILVAVLWFSIGAAALHVWAH